MPADPKPIVVSLGAGMDQSGDEFVTPPGNIRESVNTRVRRGGSVEQRRGVHGFPLGVPSIVGYHGLQPTGVIEWTGKIGNASSVGIGGKAFFPDTDSADITYCGGYSSYLPVGKSNAFLDEFLEFGENNSRCCVVGTDSDGREYTVMASYGSQEVLIVVKNDNGVRVGAFEINATMEAIDMVASLTAPRVYFVRQSGTNLRLHVITLSSSPTLEVIGGGTWSFTLADSTSGWAICQLPVGADGTSDWCFVYHSAATTVSIANYDNTTSQTTGAQTITSATAAILTVFASQEWVAVGILRDPVSVGAAEFITFVVGSLSTQDYDTLLASDADSFSAPIFGLAPKVSPFASTNEFYWAVGRGPATYDINTRTGTIFGVLTSAGTVTETATVHGTLPVSHFDKWGSIWLIWSGEFNGQFPNTPRFGRFALCKFPETGPISALIPSLELKRTVIQLASKRFGPEPVDTEFVWNVGTGKFSTFGYKRGQVETLLPVLLRSQDTKLYGVELYEYQHESHHQSRDTVEVGQKLVVAGQPFSLYSDAWIPDTGNAVARNASSELGFCEEPEIYQLAFTSLSGSLGPGSRLYKAVYEWISPLGERHRSRPSEPTSSVTTITGRNDLLISAASITSRQFFAWGLYTVSDKYFSATVLHIYRTTNGGTTYHRITPDDGAPQAVMDRGANLGFNDIYSDDEIRDNEILYTDGGVQPNDLAPSCRFLAVGEDRLWLGGLFEEQEIQCSKFTLPREPIQFSDHGSFKIRLPFPCTGLAYLDGSLIAFCETSSYLVSGDGPNNQGAGGFTLRPISDNSGCIDYRSIVETSQGVFFQSVRGISLFPRGFGSPTLLRQLNELMGEHGSGFTEVIGATTRKYSDEETVRFLLRNPTTNKRIVATLELSTQTWGYDTINDANGDPQPLSSIGDGPEGVMYGAGSGTNRFLVELEGAKGTPYDSMGSTVNRFLSEVKLAKTSLFGPAGAGKLHGVYLRGFSPATGAQVNLSMVTDFGTQTHTFSGIGSGTFFRRAVPAHSDASECQISATFTAGVGRQAGLRLFSLTLEVMPKPGTRNTQAGEQE